MVKNTSTALKKQNTKGKKNSVVKRNQELVIFSENLPKKKEPKKVALNETNKILEEISIVDADKNTVKIFLKQSANRAVRLCMSLNDMDVRPITFNGATNGRAYFKILETILKKRK